MHRYIALAGLLFAPACLNPDISDEYPVTTQADALDLADGDATTEDAVNEEAATDEDEADEDVAEEDVAEADEEDEADTPANDVADTDAQGRAPPRRTWMRR